MLFSALLLMGFIYNDGGCFLFGRDAGMNKKYIDRDGNILLTSDRHQTIDMIVDAKTNEEVLVFKEYKNDDKVDLTYIRPNIDRKTLANFKYIEDYYDYKKTGYDGNHDGGAFRIANRKLYYLLNGKDLVLELKDVIFDMSYDGFFYFTVDNENPKMYMMNLITNEKVFLGYYKSFKICNDKVMIYDTKREGDVESRINDRRVGFANIHDQTNIKNYEGYNFEKVIQIDGKKYYKIYYNLEVVNVKGDDAKGGWYKHHKILKYFNLVDENFEKILNRDVEEIHYEHVDYKKIVDTYKMNTPDEVCLFDKLQINSNDVVTYIDNNLNDKKYFILRKTKEKVEYYYLINEKGESISDKFPYDLSLANFYYNIYPLNGDRLIFIASDKDRLKNILYLENDKLIPIKYDKTKKFFLLSNNYYAVSDWDISKIYNDYNYDKHKFNNAGDEKITFYRIGDKNPIYSVKREVNKEHSDKTKAKEISVNEYNDICCFYIGETMYYTNSEASDDESKKQIEQEILAADIKKQKEEQEKRDAASALIKEKREKYESEKENYVSEDIMIDENTSEKRRLDEFESKINNINKDLLSKEFHYKNYSNIDDYEIMLTDGDWYRDIYIKNGIYLNRYVIMKDKEHGWLYAIYDIEKNKIIVEGIEGIGCLTDDTFEYSKGFKTGLMDFAGNKIFECSEFSSVEDEYDYVWGDFIENE